MRHYNSRTKRSRDLRIGPFCSYCSRLGDLYFRFNILPTKTATLCDVWFCMHSTITCATVTRELNVVATRGLNHFTAIAPAYITYNSDLMFCSCKPQLSSSSGYYYNSRSKRHSHLRFEPFCILCYRPSTRNSYLTFCPRNPLLSMSSGYNYNLKTNRHSNMGFKPFCNYRYPPGTYILKLTFCARKPQLLKTSGYYYNSRTKCHSDLQFE